MFKRLKDSIAQLAPAIGSAPEQSDYAPGFEYVGEARPRSARMEAEESLEDRIPEMEEQISEERLAALEGGGYVDSLAALRERGAMNLGSGRVRSAVVDVRTRSQSIAEEAAKMGVSPQVAAISRSRSSAARKYRSSDEDKERMSATVENLISEIKMERDADIASGVVYEPRSPYEDISYLLDKPSRNEVPVSAAPAPAPAPVAAPAPVPAPAVASLRASQGASEPKEDFQKYQGRFAHIGEVPNKNQGSYAESLPPIEAEVKVHGRELSTATAYDELINWSSRLTRETPLFQRALSLASARSVVDVGCGTGRHALMLAEWGYKVLAVDSNPDNIARAQDRAEKAAAALGDYRKNLSFAQGSLGIVSHLVGPEKTEAIFCLGDTLPRVGSVESLREALQDFARSLTTSGILALEFCNNAHFLQERLRSSVPKVFDTVEGTKVFMRVMDFHEAEGKVESEFLSLSQWEDGSWSVESEHSDELFISVMGISRELMDAGFDVLEVSGDYSGRPVDNAIDEKVFILARRRRYRSSL